MEKFQSLLYVIKMCNMYTKSLINVALILGKNHENCEILVKRIRVNQEVGVPVCNIIILNLHT